MAPQRDRGAALWLTVAAAAVAGLVAIYVSTLGLAPLPGAGQRPWPLLPVPA